MMTSTKEIQPPTSILSKWRQKLITQEDPGHIHKLLGIVSLVSFAWRLSQFGTSDLGFATYPAWTLPTVLLHGTLTLSSFLFHIPPQRIRSGDRIWPEYRLHALIFLGRSLALIVLYYYEQIKHLQPNYLYNLAIVLTTLFAADLSSWSVGPKYHSNSIRELNAHPAIQFFFSFMQIGATASCLHGLRRYSLPFYFCFVVQVNPFLMTLRRKNLLSQSAVISMYGLMLLFGIVITLNEFGHSATFPLNSFLCQGVIINFATMLRLGPRIPIIRIVQDNKYILWSLLGLLLHHIRPIFEQEELPKETIMACHTLRFSMFVMGVWKGFLRPYSREDTTQKNI